MRIGGGKNEVEEPVSADGRAWGQLPCDLPLEEGRRARPATDGFAAEEGDARPRWGLATLPGRTRAVILVLLAVLAALLVCAAVLGVRGCAQDGPGAVCAAAGQAADGLVSDALQAGRGVAARAERGEGLVSGTVCIDAGHGGGSDLTLTPVGPGSDEMQYVEPGGASGCVTGAEESEVTLAVAKLLQQKLADLGVTVVMVREDNDTVLSSEQRAEVANSCGADLFVRLHCDGTDDSSVSGFCTLVPGYNDWTAGIVDSSAYAASVMHPIIVAETGANDQGVVQRTDLAGFNFCQVPSVLFEMGFMSNPDEDVRLSDPAYQETLAQAICDATVAYLESLSG